MVGHVLFVDVPDVLPRQQLGHESDVMHGVSKCLRIRKDYKGQRYQATAER